MLTSGEEIDEAWIADLLGISRAAVGSVTCTSSTTMLSNCVQVRVDYGMGEPTDLPTRLFVKFSREVPELDMSFGRREVDFYRVAVPLVDGAPVPTCYSAQFDAERNRCEIVLDDLTETHSAHTLSQVPPTVKQCEQIVRAIAKYQALFWDHSEFGASLGPVPSEDVVLVCIGPNTAKAVREHLGREPEVIADKATIAGLMSALEKWYANA